MSWTFKSLTRIYQGGYWKMAKIVTREVKGPEWSKNLTGIF
jgi:hypothetical protein